MAELTREAAPADIGSHADGYVFYFKATETGDTNFDRISGDLKGAIGQVDSTADMDLVYDVGIYEVGVQYQSAADDAASSLGQSMGF